MTAVLVDTGAWIALGSPRDEHHVAAAKHYETLRPTPLVTTNYVALAFKSLLERAAAKDRLRIVWIDPRLEAEGWSLLRQHANGRLSLTDATSAAVARHRRVREIFGFDRDFEALGFTVTPATR